MTTQSITQYGVNDSLTPKSRSRVVETDAYGAFSRRVIRAYSRRVGSGDIDNLAGLIHLAGELNDHINTAVAGLREAGYSWAEIAARAGMSRQAAQQRWGGHQ
jgi:hypothetical protein